MKVGFFLIHSYRKKVLIKLSWRSVQYGSNRGPNRRTLVSDACQGPKVDFAVTQWSFERFKSLKCQNDPKGMLNSIFESKYQRDTLRSFSLVVGLSVFRIYVSARPPVKCPMTLTFIVRVQYTRAKILTSQ